ncbi:MAG: phage integrase SAM-like domain-containing protein, partial [Planctomycetes bacterium]|nr:phage integrase SAM-like domain-containing protein [Planctomycetota bacterium]
MDQITVGDCHDWRAWLANRGFAEASLRTHARNAKTVFRAAVEDELIARSPFRKLVSTAVAAVRDRYIEPDEADTILAACPDVQWRTLFALARFAGLRVPSETHILTWADVDWSCGRLSVFAPKTERYEKYRRRSVPIIPKLMLVLQDAYDAANEELCHYLRLLPEKDYPWPGDFLFPVGITLTDQDKAFTRRTLTGLAKGKTVQATVQGLFIFSGFSVPGNPNPPENKFGGGG